jgi:hypothetical protein
VRAAAGGHLAQHLPVSSAHGALPLPDLRRRRGGGAGGLLHVCADFAETKNVTDPSMKMIYRELDAPRACLSSLYVGVERDRGRSS